MTNLCCLGISLRKKLGKEFISNVKCVFSVKKLSLTQKKLGKEVVTSTNELLGYLFTQNYCEQ
jgi:hypothetical protein